jgi:hypothetical protein
MNQVAVKELTPHCATRAEGLAAFNTLMTLDFTSVTVDLDDAPFLTFTFLDEMVYRADEVGILSQISLKCGAPATQQKLANISKTRNVEIITSSKEQENHPIAPRDFTELERFFYEDKNTLPITDVTPIPTETVKKLHIRELTGKFVTRQRAAEALTNLAKLEFEFVSIALNNELKLSYSFLDELIYQAAKTDLLPRITFRTDHPATLDKLDHISNTRNLEISAASVDGEKHEVISTSFSHPKANLVENKDNLTAN